MDIGTITEGIEQNLIEDPRLDYIKTIEWTSTIMRISSLVLGILAIVILILIPIVCALELIYITIPTLRSATDKYLYGDDTKGFVQHTLKFTLKDAIKAVEIANTIEQGENTALKTYLKIKIKAIMIEVLILVFVVGGGGTAVVNAAIRLFKGILNGMFGTNL